MHVANVERPLTWFSFDFFDFVIISKVDVEKIKFKLFTLGGGIILLTKLNVFILILWIDWYFKVRGLSRIQSPEMSCNSEPSSFVTVLYPFCCLTFHCKPKHISKLIGGCGLVEDFHMVHGILCKASSSTCIQSCALWGIWVENCKQRWRQRTCCVLTRFYFIRAHKGETCVPLKWHMYMQQTCSLSWHMLKLLFCLAQLIYLKVGFPRLDLC